MSGPELICDVYKIEQNTRAIVNFCSSRGIAVSGVTKVTCGWPHVARAMLRGGVTSLGESRLENIHRLRLAGIQAPIMLLRIPPLSAVEEIVTTVDISLNSEVTVIRALNKAAAKQGKIHDILLMIDLGDLREGIWPQDLHGVVEQIMALSHIRLRGLGTNLTCYGGVLPSTENMTRLVTYAEEIEKCFGIELDIISGGNSSSLDLLKTVGLPERINHLRIGEAIMLGRETAYGKRWPGTEIDAFRIQAELIEVKTKPSVPIGQTGMDAFGGTPTFTDRGEILRGILNIGREDVAVDGLHPVDDGVEILGASSDHLLLDLSGTESSSSKKIGATVSFLPDYGALLAAMTSEYVFKSLDQQFINYRNQNQDQDYRSEDMNSRNLSLIGESHLFTQSFAQDLIELNFQLDQKATGCLRLVGGEKPELVSQLKSLSAQNLKEGLLWIGPFSPFHNPEGAYPADRNELERLIQNPKSIFSILSLVDPENIVLVGLQNADRQEARLLKEMNMNVFTMEDIDLMGIREVLSKALRLCANGTEGLYVRFCPDSVDTGAEGLTPREVHLMLELIARSGLLRAFDFSGYLLDQNSEKENYRLQRFILSVLGKRILGG